MFQNKIEKPKTGVCIDCEKPFKQFKILGSIICRPCMNDREDGASAWRLMLAENEKRSNLVNLQTT